MLALGIPVMFWWGKITQLLPTSILMQILLIESDFWLHTLQGFVQPPVAYTHQI